MVSHFMRTAAHPLTTTPVTDHAATRSASSEWLIRWHDVLPAFALICAAHGAVLWGLTKTWVRAPEVVTPPALIGALVSESPEITAPTPLPIAPEQQPKRRPKAVMPPPQGPPSERAVTVPPSEPVDFEVPEDNESAPPPATLVASPTSADASEPVAPPRSDASFLNNPAPRYPPESRHRREEGRVLLDVLILADGTVGEIKLKHSSGFPRLDEAALNAVRRWRYVPAKRGAVPIDYWHVQPLDFELTR